MENETKDFTDVILEENQIGEGIEYNTVTSDDTVQDNFNTDSIKELIEEGAELINE